MNSKREWIKLVARGDDQDTEVGGRQETGEFRELANHTVPILGACC